MDKRVIIFVASAFILAIVIALVVVGLPNTFKLYDEAQQAQKEADEAQREVDKAQREVEIATQQCYEELSIAECDAILAAN